MATIEKLKEDIAILKDDLILYTSELASNATQSSKELKLKLEEKIRNTKYIIEDLEEEVKTKTRELVAKTDDKVREKPYHAAGVALLVGAAIGFLLGKNK